MPKALPSENSMSTNFTTRVLKWLGRLDSNQGNARFRVWCLTTWLHPNNGGLRRTRTFDKTVNSRLLYLLSYKSMKAKPALWRTASSYARYRFLGFPSSLYFMLFLSSYGEMTVICHADLHYDFLIQSIP